MSDEPNPITLEEATARAEAAANPGQGLPTYTCICHGGPHTTPCPGPVILRAMIPTGSQPPYHPHVRRPVAARRP